MTKRFKHSASVEQYLANEMAPLEKAAFRKELISNPDLAEEMRLTDAIDSALGREDVIELRRKLISAMNTGRLVKDEVPVVQLNSRRWLYTAASLIAIIAVAATLYLQTSRTISNDSLFNEYYSAENIVDQTRGDQNIVEALLKFQQKDFRSASTLFKSILDKENSNMAVWFYFGISNIETQNYYTAIKTFKTIIQQNDNLYIEHAEWYLGLCYLKNNLKDSAVKQFEVVATNPDNFHRQEAKSILGKLQPE